MPLSLLVLLLWSSSFLALYWVAQRLLLLQPVAQLLLVPRNMFQQVAFLQVLAMGCGRQALGEGHYLYQPGMFDAQLDRQPPRVPKQPAILVLLVPKTMQKVLRVSDLDACVGN